jgi:hypothetical protein
MPLTQAEEDQLNRLNEKRQEKGDAPKKSLKEILHEVVDTVGRPHLHESIDALDGPDSVDDGTRDDDDEKVKASDDDEPNPKPNTVK